MEQFLEEEEKGKEKRGTQEVGRGWVLNDDLRNFFSIIQTVEESEAEYSSVWKLDRRLLQWSTQEMIQV